MSFKLLFLLILLSCKSHIEITDLKKDLVVSASNIQIEQIDSNGFGINVTVENDNNLNAIVKFHFCNQTINPNCDVMNESEVTLSSNDGITFSKNVLRSLYGLKRGDLIKYHVDIQAPDGARSNTNLGNLFSFEYNITIHRSISVGQTSYLVFNDSSGGPSSMSIDDGLATFQVALPTSVGVGDVVQFDSDGNSSFDNLLFISEVVSATEYNLLDKNGRKPEDLSSTVTWEIYRAYTSLANAISGVENTGLDDSLEDFESGNVDLVSKKFEWKFAIYSNDNGPEIVNDLIDFSGWVTGKDNSLIIYAPFKESDVRTTSNRHDGKFDHYKYYLHVDSTQNNSRGLKLQSDNITIDGLQFYVVNNGNGGASALFVDTSEASNDFFHEYKNNIILGSISTTTESSSSSAIYLSDYNHDGSEYRISNNYISGFKASGCSGVDSANAIVTWSNSFIYNNTILDSGCAARFMKDSITYRFKNNLIVNSQGVENYSSYGLGSSSNSSTGTSLGATGDKGSEVILFTEEDIHDYRLSGQSYSSIGTAEDLSADPYYPINTDIRGVDRVRWDRGASTAPTSIFRSIGPGNTASLENGAMNSMTISVNSDGHTEAQFLNPIANNIGVGDVIQYDGVGALAFIQLRINSQRYVVKNSLGENAIEVSSDTSWDIYRAYTSLWSAENSNENSGLDDNLENFDTWSSGRDLLVNNEQWNMALYADATSGRINVQDWYSDNFNTLRIFAPKEAYNVGVGQRHNGIWDNSKAHITVADGNIPIYFDENLRGLIIEGLQVANNDTDSTNSGHGTMYNFQQPRMFFVVKNSIFVKGGNSWWSACGIKTASINDKGRIYFYNNLIDGYGRGICLYAPGGYDDSITVVDNSTIVNSTNRSINLGDYGTHNTYLFRNNIAQLSAGDDYNIGGTPDILIANTNHSSDATAFGSNTIRSFMATFEDTTIFDYSLSTSDTALLDTGLDLSSDLYLKSNKDIKGAPRGVWDLGAFAD